MTTISQTSAQTAAAGTTTQSMGALKGLNTTFDMFLKLLTTQMKNQDPLKPQDPSEMTNQLVAFANVEQNIATNSRLDRLVALQENNRVSGALSYMGRTVEVESDLVALQNGSASVSYTLEDKAKTVRLEVFDAAGKRVRSVTGDTDAGPHLFRWDGKDDLGNQLADGVYKVSVAAHNDKDETVENSLTTWGQVSGVDMTSANAKLNIGPLEIEMEKILAVMQ